MTWIDAHRDYCEALAAHYAMWWSDHGETHNWHRGPRHELPASYRVLRFAPSTKRACWTYATLCMSQPTDDERLELHLLSPVADVAHVELLTTVAHYHRTGARLGLGHTVNFGRPWLPGSGCTHGLVSLPYLDGPELEVLALPDGPVRFLWLIPVFAQEVEWKKRHGLEALESRLEAASFNYADPMRRSVV